VVPHIPIYVDAGMGVGADFYNAQDKMLAEEADRTEEAYRARLGAAGLAGEWLRLPSDDEPAMRSAIAFCRAADLVVASQYDEALPGAAAYFPEDLVLGAGRPVVLVPAAGRFSEIGKRVLIAWSGTRESARAAFDALPLLYDAAEVRVFLIGRSDAADPRGQSAEDLATTLRRRGVAAEAHVAAPGEGPIADQTLAHAAEYGADLMVMGCYGHSRLRETIFGGVTSGVLDRMNLPVLMSY
ncbi:MAG TPA: universal stress protein, partial [Afifellaceae bacterium]|nr:universal stress protein [Afifellaceae bacterium]